MDWEKKFNSILKDTETNLSRVKNKFQSSTPANVTWVPKFYSTPLKRSTSLADLELPSAPKYTPQYAMNQSFNGDPYRSATPYPSSMQIMQEKLDQQNNSIEHLRGTIHRLETDRQNYKEQIRDLRNEIFTLTEKASNRRPDPSIERRIETMRREFLGEIQLLQSQLQINSAKGSNSNMSETQLMSLSRDVLEIKYAYRDELEGCRRDVEILRSRISKVELELASVLSNRREVEQRQDNLDRTLNTLTQVHTPRIQPPPPMTSNRHFENLQINELRSALSALRDKIDILESSSQQFTSTLKPKKPHLYSNGLSKKKKSSLQSDILDDLDLSDDDTESSDFTEFEPPRTRKDKKMKIDEKGSEDDLDLDDLDLSDDDLSDNSLSDPLDNDDLS